jgi:hypothetical protein
LVLLPFRDSVILSDTYHHSRHSRHSTIPTFIPAIPAIGPFPILPFRHSAIPAIPAIRPFPSIPPFDHSAIPRAITPLQAIPSAIPPLFGRNNIFPNNAYYPPPTNT